ncbi:pentapeptide repeat-containing protein [Streptomyces sp. NPDC056704]|uniref:pentapeptide repeat-containing protein n=1 Tax=Streptomyces sp. NPDC056704 TaxID=3345917 RepID=UPI0036C3973B
MSSIQSRDELKNRRRELEINQQGQVTERFTAAIDQLGSGSLDIRLGGLYALQRIMHDSPKDQPSIVNILSAYMRTHGSRPQGRGNVAPKLKEDIATAASIIGSRNVKYDGEAEVDWRDLYIQGLKLPRASLAGVYLRGADISRSDFSDGDLDKGNLSKMKAAKASFERASLRGAILDGSILTAANLRRSKLYGASLKGVELYESSLREANLSHANMEKGKLAYANLNGANLSWARLGYSDISGANLDGADLSNADLTHLKGTFMMRCTNLEGCSDYPVKLTGSNLVNSDLANAQLENAEFSGADLSGALLTSATLANADLQGVPFGRAFMGGTDLEGADLTGADLSKAIGLTATQVAKALLDANTKLPSEIANDPRVKRAIQQGESVDSPLVVPTVTIQGP